MVYISVFHDILICVSWNTLIHYQLHISWNTFLIKSLPLERSIKENNFFLRSILMEWFPFESKLKSKLEQSLKCVIYLSFRDLERTQWRLKVEDIALYHLQKKQRRISMVRKCLSPSLKRNGWKNFRFPSKREWRRILLYTL